MPSRLPTALRNFAAAAQQLADALEGIDLEATTEDAADIAAAEAALAEVARTGTLPGKVVHALLGGVSPVRAWREHLGLSQKELAERSGLGQGYLSQIETGKRGGSVEVMKRLAAALGTTVEQLLADHQAASQTAA